MVGPPKVINKRVNDKLLEPFEVATVEVPENHMGPVVEVLGRRRGQMFDMQGVGYVLLFLSIPFMREMCESCDMAGRKEQSFCGTRSQHVDYLD